MSKTQNLKRQIEELHEEKMLLEQDSKRLKQDNKLYQVQKSMEKQEYIRLDELVCNPGLEHVALQIFKNLDRKSLGSCRSVSKGWKACIDNDKHWWQSLILDYKSFMIKKVHKRYSNDQLEEFIEAMQYIHDNESLKNLELFATFMTDYCQNVKANLDTNDFNSPLHYAADRNRIDILQIIARSPMKKMNLENWNQFTRPDWRYREGNLLSDAIVKNQIDVVEFYMNLKGDKKVDFEKDSLFHKACYSTNHQVVELFLERAEDLKIDLNARNSVGWTPKMYAINKKVMELLLNDDRIKH